MALFSPSSPILRTATSTRASRLRERLVETYRHYRPERLDYSDDCPSAGPLALIGAAEADVRDDDQAYATLIGAVSARLATMGATRVIASLLAQCSDPDRLLLLMASQVRRTAADTYRGRVAADFIDDLTAAHVAGQGHFCVNIAAPWRPDRDSLVADSMAQTVLIAAAGAVCIDPDEFGVDLEANACGEGCDGTCDATAGVLNLFGRMRTALFAEAAA